MGAGRWLAKSWHYRTRFGGYPRLGIGLDWGHSLSVRLPSAVSVHFLPCRAASPRLSSAGWVEAWADRGLPAHPFPARQLR